VKILLGTVGQLYYKSQATCKAYLKALLAATNSLGTLVYILIITVYCHKLLSLTGNLTPYLEACLRTICWVNHMFWTISAPLP
jgi:hypothetical protein